MVILLSPLPLLLFFLSLCVPSGHARLLQPSCEDFSNCFSCGEAERCAWCGSRGACQSIFNDTLCPFTLWKRTCCRVLTPRGCDECVRYAACGWCELEGCTEGSADGPTSASCPQWHFQSCPSPATLFYTFSAAAVLFGFTVTVGGGLSFATVAILVFFLRRMYLRRQAAQAFSQFLDSHRNSCFECEDIVASLRCRNCDRIYCSSCAQMPNCKKLKGRLGKHRCAPLQLDPSQSALENRHYESFAHLSSQINGDE